jgi:hypothetical protein
MCGLFFDIHCDEVTLLQVSANDQNLVACLFTSGSEAGACVDEISESESGGDCDHERDMQNYLNPSADPFLEFEYTHQ